MLRVRQNGLVWMAPMCSSFVPACVSVSFLGKVDNYFMLYKVLEVMVSLSTIFLYDVENEEWQLRKRNLWPEGDESREFVANGNSIADTRLKV